MWGRAVMVGAIVLAQQVAPEIAVKPAPDRVDVVAAILRVVVFDEEAGALDAVVVRLTMERAARPGESDLADVGGADPIPLGARNRGRHVAEILVDQREQLLLLVGRHVGDRKTLGRKRGHPTLGAGDEILGCAYRQ